jgi:hypothetical protein
MADKDEADKQPKIKIKFDPKTREIAVNRIPEYAGFKKER